MSSEMKCSEAKLSEENEVWEMLRTKKNSYGIYQGKGTEIRAILG